jgi:hypothetical protein
VGKKKKRKTDKKHKIPKTLEQKLSDLDAHMFLLRENWRGLKENTRYLKTVSAELRALVCYSSDREGLLWRLADELGIDDTISLHVPGKLKRDHPLASLLRQSLNKWGQHMKMKAWNQLWLISGQYT